jgi:hypothetical protein
MYAEPGTPDARHFCGVMLRELSLNASDVFAQHYTLVLPQVSTLASFIASLMPSVHARHARTLHPSCNMTRVSMHRTQVFVSQYDEEPEVAALFAEIWEACTTKSAAMRLYMSEILALVVGAEGLKSQSWPCKARAARAIQAMAADRTDALVPHTTPLAEALLAELPGRLWDGKESLLHALGALALTCKAREGAAAAAPTASLADPPKVVAAVLEALARKKTVFRKAALECLDHLLQVRFPAPLSPFARLPSFSTHQ